MYTFVGGFLIAIIGIAFMLIGVFVGRITMKNKLSKQEKAE